MGGVGGGGHAARGGGDGQIDGPWAGPAHLGHSPSTQDLGTGTMSADNQDRSYTSGPVHSSQVVRCWPQPQLVKKEEGGTVGIQGFRL